MSVIAPIASKQAISPDLLRPAPARMALVSLSRSLATVAPAYWATLTPEEQRLLRHVRIISGGLLVKVNPPAMPHAFSPPDPGPITGLSITVLAGGNVQTAFNQAAADDPNLHHEVILEEGVAFQGNLLIPAKRGPGTGWITVRSRALAALPPAGERITRAHSPLMPKLVSPNLASPLALNDSAVQVLEGWRFVGIEGYFSTTSTALIYAPIFAFGWGLDGGGRNSQGTIDQTPRRIAVERCYLHYGSNTQNQKVGVRAHAHDLHIRDSIITGQAQGAEGIAIELDSGHAVLIENNELCGAGQNIYFNSNTRTLGEALWSQQRPTDVIIRRNYLWKEPRWYRTDPTWDGLNWTLKPGIEIKYVGGSRVLIEGNTFHNIWSWSPIHLSTTDTVDVTIQHNRFTHCKAMFMMWDTTNQGITAPASGIRRVKVWNNLATDVIFVPNSTGYDNGAFGWIISSTNAAFGGQTSDIWVEHNTVIGTAPAGGGMTIGGTGIDRLRFANNLFGWFLTREGSWGWSDAQIQGTGPNPAVRMVITPGDGDVLANAMLRTFTTNTGPPYTQATFLPPNNPVGQFLVIGTPEEAGVGRNDGVLAPGCVCIGAGVGFDNKPDGSDLGVDFAALAAAQTAPNPAPTPAPRPSAPVFQLLSATTQEGRTMPWIVKVSPCVIDTQGNRIRQPDAIAHRLYRDGVKIQDVAQPATGPTEFTLTVPEPEIVLKLGASALDAAGNESVITALDVALDATAPIPPTFRLVSATWVA